MAGDPGRIRQILLNLIGNAVKFTEEGDVAVAVGLTGSVASRYLRFTVTDTGPGIHPDDQSRIFGEFYQADVSLTRAHGGTGLGLAITKQLVELMAGKLGFESTWGEGARFWVELPLIVVEDDDQGRATRVHLSQSRQPKKPPDWSGSLTPRLQRRPR